MKITKQQLIAINACEGGLERFIKQTNNTEEPVLISSLVGGCNTTSDLVWLAGRLFKKEKIQEFVRKSALLTTELIKPYCKNDQYEVIINFLETGNNAEEARSAAIAAHEATAASAANVAAYHAARSARAACDTYYAYYDYKASPEKVNDLLKELFTK